MFDFSTIQAKLSNLSPDALNPKSRDTVQDCAMAVVGQLMGIWMQGNSPLATEIDNLLAALKNSNDPLLKENLNLFERKILWSMLNTLTKNKEMFMRQQQLSEQNK